jgi:hypothetical protein
MVSEVLYYHTFKAFDKTITGWQLATTAQYSRILVVMPLPPLIPAAAAAAK